MEPTLRPLPEVVVNPDLAQARMYLSQGRVAEAKASLQSCLAVAPDDREAIKLLLSADAMERRTASEEPDLSRWWDAYAFVDLVFLLLRGGR